LVFRKIDQEEGFIGWERFLLSPRRPIARLEMPKFFKNGGLLARRLLPLTEYHFHPVVDCVNHPFHPVVD